MPEHARTRYRHAPLVAPLAALALATGCTGATAHTKVAAAVTPAPSASPSTPTPTSTKATAIPTVGATADPNATEVAFTGPAADRFGAANVAVAYHLVIKENRDGYANASLLLLKKPRVLDFSYLDHYFTKQVLDQIHPAEARVAAGKPTNADLSLLTGAASWDLPEVVTGFTPAAVPARNFTYSGATTYIGKNALSQPVLVIKMSFGIQYVGTVNGKKVYFQVKHPESVGLVQTGDKTQPWKIDSYESSNDVKGPLPDKD